MASMFSGSFCVIAMFIVYVLALRWVGDVCIARVGLGSHRGGEKHGGHGR
jgi:hypothetical protein